MVAPSAPSRKDMEKLVIAEVIQVIKEAEKAGLDSMAEVRRRFPGIPDGVYWSAWCKLQDEDAEAWWDTLEKTIEGEIIKRALKAPKPQ